MKHGAAAAIAVIAGGVAVSAAAVSAGPADADVTGYLNRLREVGFLVNGNEIYLVELATIVCNAENAGVDDLDIEHYMQNRENLTFIQAVELTNIASVWYCSDLHPRIVP